MEVFVGPTFTINVPDQTREDLPTAFRISGPPKFFAGGSPESSSSIGTPDDSDNDEEVQSQLKGRNGLGSLDSLEDSLPIKRGLSSHFDGKSKSFTDLSQVNNLKELQKQESPFNKRRRVLIASKFSRKSSFYSWSNPKSMPLLPVNEDHNDDYYDYGDNDYEDYEEEEKARKMPFASSSSSSSNSLVEDKKQEDNHVQIGNGRMHESYADEMRLRLRSFKSRSFSLADLQEHDDEEDDEDD
ncbi:unnamed protein product [Trifolium pratense]|uniref:Uncharacterized protein n=1 Tax=Trifolium pratense TaxID=57577 RepID=A0ACB0JGG5_TRIPR|nr:unnamed protein product [Trifolium pratense]